MDFAKNREEGIRDSYSDPMRITSSSTAAVGWAGAAFARAGTRVATQLLGYASPP